MTELEKFIIFLSQFELGVSKIQKILNTLGDNITLQDFCKAKFDDKILPKDSFKKMKSLANEQLVENYYNNCLDKNIILVTKFSDKYPSRLRNLPDAPFYLFCKGDLSLFEEQTIGIVGTRKPTSYGRACTEKFARALASSGIVIISGLAYGVDSISHRKCLEVGGKTIAVLGSGFNKIYPAEHESLAEEISQKGLLVSEYLPSHVASKYTFPERNRIIAGLSDGILITEAGLKSGTIHTKDFALDYGKNIYAVPGQIDSEFSALTNDIIKSGQGNLVMNEKDILDDYYIEKEIKNNNKIVQLTLEEEKIVSLLSTGIKDIDYITKNCDLSISEINSTLTTMEIRGIISRLPAGTICLN